MIGLSVKIEDYIPKVEAAAGRATFKSLGHGAARVRKDTVASIERSEDASPPGSPPHSARGHLPRAVRFHVEEAESLAVIGARASVVGEAGAAHEFGGEFRDQTYPERPYQFPALEKNLDRFPGDWAGSIGE